MKRDLPTTLLATKVATAAVQRMRPTSPSISGSPRRDHRAMPARHGVTARDLHRIVTRVTANRESGRDSGRARPASAADAGLALMIRVGEHTLADDSSGFLAFPAVVLPADRPDSFGLVHTASLVPDHDSIWRPPAGATMLWDVWDEILDEAVVVDPDPTPDQQAAIQDARQLLFADPDAGTPSEAYERYRRLLDEYLDAAAALADATAGEDDEDGEGAPSERALEAALDAAAQRLAVEGRQAEITAALDTIVTYGLSQPSIEWADARQAFDLVTNRKKDPNSNAEYLDTTFLPGSFDDAAWTPIDLDVDEIAALARLGSERFPRLADSRLFDDVVADDDGTLCVKRIRAELTLLSVLRGDWFHPELLGLRCWRFRDQEAEPVSDGGDPATGRLPAYVTRLAVVRNVEIERVRVNAHDRRTGRHRPSTMASRSRARLTSIIERVRQLRPRPTESGSRVRDHRSSAGRPRVRDHRRPTPRPEPVPPYRDEAPRIAGFLCQLVPRCPDPDPVLFPDLALTEETR